MKRFYKDVSTREEILEENGPGDKDLDKKDLGEKVRGFAVLLDGRPVRTPARKPLVLPTSTLANGIAAEWQAQQEDIKPIEMPLMRIAATSIDRVAENLAAVAEETARYAGTDLLCYRADEPETLIHRQAETWQPLLDWASLRFDAPLRVTSGIVPISQSEASLRALAAALPIDNPFALTALADLTGTCGSLILALAVYDDRIDGEAAADAALLDEIFQAERWGEDREAAIRRAGVRGEITAAANFLALLR